MDPPDNEASHPGSPFSPQNPPFSRRVGGIGPHHPPEARRVRYLPEHTTATGRPGAGQAVLAGSKNLKSVQELTVNRD